MPLRGHLVLPPENQFHALPRNRLAETSRRKRVVRSAPTSCDEDIAVAATPPPGRHPDCTGTRGGDPSTIYPCVPPASATTPPAVIAGNPDLPRTARPADSSRGSGSRRWRPHPYGGSDIDHAFGCKQRGQSNRCEESFLHDVSPVAGRP